VGPGCRIVGGLGFCFNTASKVVVQRCWGFRVVLMGLGCCR